MRTENSIKRTRNRKNCIRAAVAPIFCLMVEMSGIHGRTEDFL